MPKASRCSWACRCMLICKNMKRILYALFILPLFVLTGCPGGAEPIPFEVDKRLEGNFMLDDSVVRYDVECRLQIPVHSGSVQFQDILLPGFGEVEEMSVPSLPCIFTGSDYVLGTDTVIPVVNGEASPVLMMTDVSAVYGAGKFYFSAETSLGKLSFSNAVSKEFEGTLAVGSYERDAIVAVKEKQTLSVVDVVLNDVKFSPLMPVTIDITLKDIPCYNNGNFTFSAENVVPYINKEPEPQPKYKFADIFGTIVDDNKLVLVAKMADDLAFYVSGKDFVFTGTLK